MPLSAGATREAYAEQSGEAWIALLTITHPDLSVPGDIIRVANQGVAVDAATGVQYVDSNGQRFHAVGFELELPNDQEGEPPKAKIRLDGVGPIELTDGTTINIIDELRRLTSAPALHLDIVLASLPNVIEHTLDELTLVHASGDAGAIEGDLAYEDVLNQEFPAAGYTPANFPGLFS